MDDFMRVLVVTTAKPDGESQRSWVTLPAKQSSLDNTIGRILGLHVNPHDAIAGIREGEDIEAYTIEQTIISPRFSLLGFSIAKNEKIEDLNALTLLMSDLTDEDLAMVRRSLETKRQTSPSAYQCCLAICQHKDDSFAERATRRAIVELLEKKDLEVDYLQHGDEVFGLPDAPSFQRDVSSKRITPYEDIARAAAHSEGSSSV